MERPDEFVPVSLEPDPVIEYYKQFIDRSLLRENRKLTPTERVRKMQELGKVYAELRRAGKKLRDLEVIAELEAQLEEEQDSEQ